MHTPRLIVSLAALLVLAGCAGQRSEEPAPRPPAEVKAQIVRLLPAKTVDRQGWATDIYAAFAAQGISPTTQNLCSVLAVTEQESTFQVDPPVPGLGKIARDEIDRRAAKVHIPSLLVSGALQVRSPNGKTYSERLSAARSEKELSAIFDDFIGSVPMGRTLFSGFNPVHTGGPMQVSVAFAEQDARERDYPYPVDGSIRHEVFSRRGGIYFGVAHLLGYEAPYDRMIYRFADYNAGFYASRNAAFQNAIAIASGAELSLDGDLVSYDSDKPGATERAVRSLARRIGASDEEIRDALEKGESADLEKTRVYREIFALAQRAAHAKLPRATIPRIALKSPKITRKLTTEWFATRVDRRYQACLAKASGR